MLADSNDQRNCVEKRGSLRAGHNDWEVYGTYSSDQVSWGNPSTFRLQCVSISGDNRRPSGPMNFGRSCCNLKIRKTVIFCEPLGADSMRAVRSHRDWHSLGEPTMIARPEFQHSN